MKKEYNEFISLVNVSEKLDQKVLDKTINKKKTINYLKPVLISCAVIIVSIMGIVYADDIIKTFNTLRYNYNKEANRTEIHSDAIAEINYDADIPETERGKFDELELGNYTYEELEKLLGIKLLKSKLFKNNTIHQYITRKVDNKISSASFGISNLMNYDFKSKYNLPDDWHDEIFEMTFSFKTKYYEKELTNSALNDTKFWISGYPETEEYYIKNLNTSALIIIFGFGKNCIIQFDYDNISYYFDFKFLGHYDPDSVYYRIEEILESLSY